MSTTDHLASLEATLAGARASFEAEKRDLLTRLEAAESNSCIHQGLASEARAAQAYAERVATRLLTQFALVEQIFADVKRQALELGLDAPAEVASKLAPKTNPSGTVANAPAPAAQGAIPGAAAAGGALSGESATQQPAAR